MKTKLINSFSIVGKGHCHGGDEHGHDHGHEHTHSGTSQVGLMVTTALFLHKAPEAASFGTFILHK